MSHCLGPERDKDGHPRVTCAVNDRGRPIVWRPRYADLAHTGVEPYSRYFTPEELQAIFWEWHRGEHI